LIRHLDLDGFLICDIDEPYHAGIPLHEFADGLHALQNPDLFSINPAAHYLEITDRLTHLDDFLEVFPIHEVHIGHAHVDGEELFFAFRTEHLQQLRIGKNPLPGVLIQYPDTDGAGFKNEVQISLVFPNSLLRQFQVRDVLNKAEDVDGITLVIEQLRRREVGPNKRAVFAQHPPFSHEACPLTAAHFGVQCLDFRDILRIGDITPGHSQHLFLAVAKDCAEPVVYLSVSALHVEQRHAGSAGFEDAAEPVFPLAEFSCPLFDIPFQVFLVIAQLPFRSFEGGYIGCN